MNAEVVTSTEAIGTLDIDDDLVPAVIPYLNCLTDSRGVRRYSDGNLEKPKFPVGADCREQRSLAEKNSVRLLTKLRRLDKREIEDRIRLQFSAIDQFHAPRENKTLTLSLALELRDAFRG